MALTHAERQRSYRERQSRRMAELAATVADLEQRLAAALAEVDRLSALACQHPAAAVQDGCCQACGADVW